MGTLFLIIVHIVFVTAVYITAYRIGYGACRDQSRRRAEACTAPLTTILEELNFSTQFFVVCLLLHVWCWSLLVN